MFVKINVTLVKKQKHLLQISVRELHNDLILPNFGRCFSGAITIDLNTCTEYTSLRKYMTKYIKPVSNIDKIACGFKTCITAMLLKSYLN